MTMLAIVFTCIALLISTQASLIPLFERYDVPNGWIKSNVAAADDAKVHIHVAITQRNLDELERLFWEVSDPDHDKYLKFLTIEQIQSLVAPPAEARLVVFDWLKENGIDEVVDFVDSVEAWTTVGVASRMFNVQFYQFTHSNSAQQVTKAYGEVRIPQCVHDVIDSIQGISDFPVPSRQRVSAERAPFRQNSPAENDVIIPQSVWSMYSMPKNIVTGSSKIGQAAIEFWPSQESFDPRDLSIFGHDVDVNVLPIKTIIGNNTPSWTATGVEASLDVQILGGINPAAVPWFWIEDDWNWLYDFAVHFVHTTTVPDVVSISYGYYEGDQCVYGVGQPDCQKLNTTSVGFVQRVNTEFMKIGLRGVSIFVASGDAGAHTMHDQTCELPFTFVEFPASSPFVTAVGATQVNNETFFKSTISPACSGESGYYCVMNGTEVAVEFTRAYFTSGGGFSNISLRPSYQDSAVLAYLRSGVKLPPSSYYNASGRAVPDVSAFGHQWYTISGGKTNLVGGSSQSAPTWAAVASLLADSFKAKTGQSFGFMNPLLYRAASESPSTFTDIITGDNIWGYMGDYPGCTGYTCTEKYDAVTGLGSPRYDQLMIYVNELADRVVARRQADFEAHNNQLEVIATE